MMYNYNEERQKTSMKIKLENGVEAKGIYIGLRIDPETLPHGKTWYQIRHCDDDWSEPATLVRGGIMVNFMGTFISDPIEGMERTGEELEITDYEFEES